MSAWRITRMSSECIRGARGMLRAVAEATPTAAENTASGAATAGGPAAGVRWNLADLYAGADDPRIESDLEGALARAERFAARWRGRLAAVRGAELADAVDELERIQEPVARAASLAGLLFAADTSAPRHGALLQRVQERGSEIRNALVFFELEWVGLDEAAAERLLADPALAPRRHWLASLRRYRPHVLSEPEERVLEEAANTGPRAFSRLFDEILGSLRFPLR